MSDLSAWIAGLSASDSAVRAEAAEQLAQQGEDAKAAAVPLVRAAGDAEEAVREWAVSALESLSSPAIEDLPALVELIPSPQADAAYWAITLIGRLAGQAAPGVSALITALEVSDNAAVKQRAAWALGKIGPPAKEAVSALRQAAESSDPRLARLVAQAIEQIAE